MENAAMGWTCEACFLAAFVILFLAGWNMTDRIAPAVEPPEPEGLAG